MLMRPGESKDSISATQRQKAQARLLEQIIVDGNQLVRQRIDQRSLGGKGRIEEVRMGKEERSSI